jgi:hypothetical protein
MTSVTYPFSVYSMSEDVVSKHKKNLRKKYWLYSVFFSIMARKMVTSGLCQVLKVTRQSHQASFS